MYVLNIKTAQSSPGDVRPIEISRWNVHHHLAWEGRAVATEGWEGGGGYMKHKEIGWGGGEWGAVYVTYKEKEGWMLDTLTGDPSASPQWS